MEKKTQTDPLWREAIRPSRILLGLESSSLQIPVKTSDYPSLVSSRETMGTRDTGDTCRMYYFPQEGHPLEGKGSYVPSSQGCNRPIRRGLLLYVWRSLMYDFLSRLALISKLRRCRWTPCTGTEPWFQVRCKTDTVDDVLGGTGQEDKGRSMVRLSVLRSFVDSS